MEKIVEEKKLLSEEIIEKRYRNFMILLYEDTTSYNFKDVLQLLKSYKDYAYIKHIPESDEKKEHFHFFLRLQNASKISSLSNKTGIPAQFIQDVKSVRSSCRYLIHKDNEEKFQYSLDQVFVSKHFEREFKKQFDDLEDENDIINKIYDFINSCSSQSYIESLQSLITFVNFNCYDRIYKRYRVEFLEYLKFVCK